jgi:serine/threonine protein kinase
MNNDDFLFSSSKKPASKTPSLKELVIEQSQSSAKVCQNISTLPHFLKRFSRGGSSWTVYLIANQSDILLKYVDFDSFKSQDLSRSKSRIGTYIKHIENEIKINILLKENKKSLQNVLVPIEIGACDTEEQPYFIIMEKCDTSLDKALELLEEPNMVKHIIIETINGIQSIQRLGILHNDLEPRNILLKQANVLISDFGISTICSEIEDEFIFYDIAMFLSYLYTKNGVSILEKLGIELTKMPMPIAEDLFLKYKTLDVLLGNIKSL